MDEVPPQWLARPGLSRPCPIILTPPDPRTPPGAFSRQAAPPRCMPSKMQPRPPSQIAEGRERHGGKALRPGVKIHRGVGPRLLAGGQGRRKPPAFAGKPARLIRKSSMRSRPTNGRRRRRVVSPRASAGRGPSDSRIPETSRVGAAASPMFPRYKTGPPQNARG